MRKRDDRGRSADGAAFTQVLQDVERSRSIGGEAVAHASRAKRQMHGQSGFSRAGEQTLECVVSGDWAQCEPRAAFDCPVRKEEDDKENEKRAEHLRFPLEDL